MKSVLPVLENVTENDFLFLTSFKSYTFTVS